MNKKFLYLTFLFFVFYSCKSQREIKSSATCDENKEFKEEFFSRIDYIEKNISVEQNEEFLSSLNFLAHYTHVSFDDMFNYAYTYPLATFEKDKVIWLSWYESEKCNNIHIAKEDEINDFFDFIKYENSKE